MYNKAMDALISNVSENVSLNITPARVAERDELDKLLANAYEAQKNNSPNLKDNLNALKKARDAYQNKFGANAFLEDSISRYQQAANDFSISSKAMNVVNSRLNLDKAESSYQSAKESHNKASQAVEFIKKSITPFITKGIHALMPRIKFYASRHLFNQERQSKLLEKHDNVKKFMPGKK